LGGGEFTKFRVYLKGEERSSEKHLSEKRPPEEMRILEGREG